MYYTLTKEQPTDSLNVKTYQVAVNITDNENLSTEHAAKFSLQFYTLLTLLKGDGGLDAFEKKL